jgi:hypothetical protein
VSEEDRNRHALAFEVVAERTEVVELAVEDEDATAVARDHRLVPGGAQVEDRQAPEAEREVGIGPVALVIGPPAAHQVGGGGHPASLGLSAGYVSEYPYDPAHQPAFAVRREHRANIGR